MSSFFSCKVPACCEGRASQIKSQPPNVLVKATRDIVSLEVVHCASVALDEVFHLDVVEDARGYEEHIARDGGLCVDKFKTYQGLEEAKIVFGMHTALLGNGVVHGIHLGEWAGEGLLHMGGYALI